MKYLFLLFLSLNAIAQAPLETYPTEETVLPGEIPPVFSEIENTVEKAEPLEVKEDKKESPKKLKSIDLREDSIGTVSIGLHYLASWIPFKKVLSYTHIFNGKWSGEFEYSWSSLDVPNFGVDLGQVAEKRYSLFAKRYFGNSFHLDFGPYYYDYHARAGASIVGQGVDIATFGAEGYGASFGMGNRWQWKNGMTLGIDWARINIPIEDTKINNSIRKDISNEKDSDDIKDVIDIFTSVPTFVLLGIKLGYTF